MKSGSVYFIECGGSIKVGFSTDVAARMQALATSAPSALTLIASIDGSFALEHAIHKYLRAHRVKGEWFDDCQPVREAIAALVNSGPSSIGYVEPCRAKIPEPSQIQAGITRLIKSKRPHGTPPWQVLKNLVGTNKRAAQNRISNRTSYSIVELRALMRTEDGLDYLKMVMADKKPAWWADVLAAEKRDPGFQAYAGRGR